MEKYKEKLLNQVENILTEYSNIKTKYSVLNKDSKRIQTGLLKLKEHIAGISLKTPIHYYPKQVSYNSPCELDDFDYIIKQYKIEWLAYWYETGSYDGNGLILYKIENKWYTWNCCHCSCYGPLEKFSLEEPIDLEASLKDGSEEFDKEFKPLYDLAMEFKHEWDES